MNVSLTPDLEKLVEEKVKTGMHHIASEVVREGLRLLKERDQRLLHLRADVRTGFDAIDRGDLEEHDERTCPWRILNYAEIQGIGVGRISHARSRRILTS